MHKYIVLDTNILLLEASNLLTLATSEDTIVLPETVLDEVDSKKSGHSEIAYQAREVGRLLSKAKIVESTTDENGTFTYLSLKDRTILVVSNCHYPKFEAAPDSIINDRKIIYVATLFPQDETIFISNDVMCRIRAQSIGLNIRDHKVVELTSLEFTKKLEVTSTLFPLLHNMAIAEVDSEYKVENFNYVFKDMDTGQEKLATISNGLIDILGKETEKKLRQQDLNPLNSGQLFLSHAIQNPTVDIVVCEAMAGSGKTATAISNAISLVRRGKYKSITYVRASVDDVDKAEEVGFLSGNDEKMAVYLHPLEDTLDFIARARHKDAKETGDKLDTKILETKEKIREQCKIEAITGLGMRGRTFHDTIFIIDEAANQSKASLQKMLTRIGKNCKVIIIGSQRQIDNPYLNKYTNGLSVILDACTKAHPNVKLHAVPLAKVVRGNIAEFTEHLFDKANK